MAFIAMDSRPFPQALGADMGAGRAGAILTIDLAALAANYRRLADTASGALCAGVVKADAYGLGAAGVAPVLADAGCRHFFVAHLEEGMELRRHVPADATIAVLNGSPEGVEGDFLAHDLLPVLNSLEQIEGWQKAARASGRRLPAILQVDTGMARFGLASEELDALLADPDGLAGLDLRLVMSHLACADDPAHPANAAQRAAFEAARARFPGVRASLAASSGIFLGPDYHFDLVRPGAALYGIAPQAGAPNPMRPVVRLQGRVVQVRHVPAATPVGYGHTARVSGPARLATVAVGYADGLLRSASNQGAAWLGDERLPLVGRVSMDSIVLDASALPEGAIAAGTLVDLIGPHQDVDAAAGAAGTIGYELLTGLGSRFCRRYLPA